MNFIDFVIDYYSHITSHVSQTFASCTHYTKLLFAKHCTCYCVCLLVWLTKFEIILSFWVIQFWWLKILRKMFENLNFGKLGLTQLFLKYISSHTHAFCSSIPMLWGVYKMCLWFFSKLCLFSKILWASVCFDWSNLFFDQSKVF